MVRTLNRLLTEHPLGAGVVCALLTLASFQGMFLGMLQLLVPLPLYLVALRRGPRDGLLAAAVPLVMLLLLTGGQAWFALAHAVTFSVPPVLVGWLARRGWTLPQGMVAVFSVGMLLLFVPLLLNALGWITLEEQVSSTLDEMRRQTMSALNSGPGQSDKVALATLDQVMGQFLDMLGRVLPAIMMAGWFLLHATNLMLVQFLVRRSGEDLVNPGHFQDFRAPAMLAVPVVLGLIPAYLLPGGWGYLGLNLVLYLLQVPLFQGVAVARAAFAHWQVDGLWRFAFYFTLFIWVEFVILVTLVGLLDSWVDFRGRFMKQREGIGPSER
ncbi:MAG: YybS family protein [Magnetococcus sp. WYHC-3]